MRKQLILRVIGIGLFHSILYLYVVPFVIYPRFGDDGFKFSVAVAVLVSVAVIGTAFFARSKGEKNDND